MRKVVTRPVKAPIDSWAEWAVVAAKLGFTRDAFMTAVLDAAAKYFNEQVPSPMLVGREKSPGRGDDHLVLFDGRRKREDANN